MSADEGRARVERLPEHELLAEWVSRFESHEDAGPTGESWQSEALTSLVEKSRATLLANAPRPDERTYWLCECGAEWPTKRDSCVFCKKIRPDPSAKAAGAPGAESTAGGTNSESAPVVPRPGLDAFQWCGDLDAFAKWYGERCPIDAGEQISVPSGIPGHYLRVWMGSWIIRHEGRCHCVTDAVYRSFIAPQFHGATITLIESVLGAPVEEPEPKMPLPCETCSGRGTLALVCDGVLQPERVPCPACAPKEAPL